MNSYNECSSVREQLFDYVNHEMAPDVYERISEHLKKCTACRDEAETTAQILNALPYAIPIPCDRIRRGVDKRIRAEEKHRVLKRRILRYGGLAAAFCLIMGVVLLYGRSGLLQKSNSDIPSLTLPQFGVEDSQQEVQVTVDRHESMATTESNMPVKCETLLMYIGSNLDDVMLELHSDPVECAHAKYYILDTDQTELLSQHAQQYQKELFLYEFDKNTDLSENNCIGDADELQIRNALEQGKIVVLDIG